MSHAGHAIKATDPAIAAYHAALKQFAEHGATHEGATETAFSRLLAETAKAHGWTLIPKKGMKSKVTTKQIYPDGTLEDEYYLPRGYWEAKDTDDDLDAEIRSKVKAGYPLTNSIFEDTRRAVLYRTKFADNLKKSLPRIPFAPDFKAFATAGKELAELHVGYEQLEPHPLKFVEASDVPLSYAVTDKMKLNKDKM